jgi:dTDP-4-amino-4,6-dideoxygalactose transaminase
MSDRHIFVTEPDLPLLKDLYPYLESIWASHQLTNGGPMHRELELQLTRFLNVPHVSLLANGTLALVTALQALRIRGEVITTPYSFAATSHSLLWNGLKPVFVDINPKTGNIDPERIEAAITSETSAILAVHVYGHPCDVESIKRIANSYNLRVIYDACHAFGVADDQGSILNHGDLSTLSFHATKVFNTFEGGAIVSSTSVTKERVDRLKNFGFLSEEAISDAGINGKMNELQAAVGLANLKNVDQKIKHRRLVAENYRKELQDLPGITFLKQPKVKAYNYSYMPMLVEDGCGVSRDDLYQRLKAYGVFARRYFYPLITHFSMYRQLPSATAENLPNAHWLSDRVLCLPISGSLSDVHQDRVITAVRRIVESASHCSAL